MNILALYVKDINKIAPLTDGEQERLLALIKAGDESARNRFLEAHLKHIHSIARGYLNHKVPLVDLIAHGCIGCLKAISKYDPTQGKFTTYSTYWIRQSIRHALMTLGNDVHYGHKYLARHRTIYMQQALCFESLLYPVGEEPSENTFDHEFNVNQVKTLLSLLSKRDRYVIEKRYGLGCRKQTLEQIGTKLKISRERVRQIQVKAIEKLRGGLNEPK